MQNVKNKGKYLFCMLCFLVLCVGFCHRNVQADTITLSVERFSLGGGFIHEPETVQFQKGEKYSDVIPRVLKSWRFEPRATGSGDTYYLASIGGVKDCGIAGIPDCVKAVLQDKQIIVEPSAHPDFLQEKDYTAYSGWMYTVNNVMVNVGMGGLAAKDGDVVRLMFTLSLGTDLMGEDTYAAEGGQAKKYYTAADKSALMKLMAEANENRTLWGRVDGFDAAYKDAVAVMAQMNAGQNDVADAVRAMTEIQENLPKDPLKGVVLKQSSLNMNPGKSYRLSFTTTPVNASVTKIVWESDDPSVATVDSDGTVHAQAVGTAKIRVTLNDTYTDSCSVTVKAAVGKLMLNASDLTLRTDEETAQLICTITPEDGYAELNWKSGNTNVAVVTDDGKVIPVGEGETEITVYTEDGVMASCHVKTLPSRKIPFVSNRVTDTMRVSATDSRHVQISWTAYECTDTYTVYRRAPGTNKWTALAEVTGTTYTDATVQPKRAYYYYVKAASSLWGDTRYSKDEPSDCKAVTTPVDIQYVQAPKASSFTYNGVAKAGVTAGTGYTLSGTTSAVNAGIYTATATLSSGYAWSDGSTAPLTLTWSIAKTGQTVNAKVTSKSYTLKNMKKKAAGFTIGASADGAVSYRVSRTPASGGKYITVDRNGKVTLKKNAPGGVYEITVTAAETANRTAATRVITINVTKNKQTVSAKKKSVTYKASALKKNKSYSIGAKAKGKLTYRLTKAPAGAGGYVTVSKKGKVTVKKGAPKGTYQITVTAAENKEYAAASRVVSVRVK